MDRADEVRRLMWGCFEIIRGTDLPPDLILNLITLKVLNDNDDHPYILPPSGKWESIMFGGAIRETLQRAFYELEKENRDLQGIFVYQPISVQGEEALQRLVSQISMVDFSRKRIQNEDPLHGIIAQLAEDFVEMYADIEWRKGGEFFTPEGINRLMVKLLDPKGGTVYDGTAGSGGLLIEAAKQAYPDEVKLYGQEINPRTWAICKQNFILHGLYDAQVLAGDTIRNPRWIEGYKLKKFDYVLMNPPFGLRDWGREVAETDPYGRFRYGVPSLLSGDLAFVLHALSSLKPNGKAALVVPLGILFRGGSDKEIRKSLLKDDFIEAVISLPPNLFVSTGIQVAILILTHKKKHKGKVQFIYGEESYEKRRGQNRLRPEDIEKIVKAYYQKEEVDRFSRLVPIEEIEENEYLLTVDRYIETEKAIETKIGSVRVKINAYEGNDLPLKTLDKLSNPKPFRGINPPRESEEEPNYYLINLVDVQDGEILFDQLKPVYVDPRRALRFEVKKGDVLVSSRGTALKVAVVPGTSKKLLPTNNFIVVRPKEELNPHFLKVFLESPVGLKYLETLQLGTLAPVLNPKDLASVQIPVFSLSKQQQIAQEFSNAEWELNQAIQAAQKKYLHQVKDLYGKMGIMPFIEQ